MATLMNVNVKKEKVEVWCPKCGKLTEIAYNSQTDLVVCTGCHLIYPDIFLMGTTIPPDVGFTGKNKKGILSRDKLNKINDMQRKRKKILFDFLLSYHDYMG